MPADSVPVPYPHRRLRLCLFRSVRSDGRSRPVSHCCGLCSSCRRGDSLYRRHVWPLPLRYGRGHVQYVFLQRSSQRL
nr:MAG TPA: hypothetical protein [Caudoviricetes sp.]